MPKKKRVRKKPSFSKLNIRELYSKKKINFVFGKFVFFLVFFVLFLVLRFATSNELWSRFFIFGIFIFGFISAAFLIVLLILLFLRLMKK